MNENKNKEKGFKSILPLKFNIRFINKQVITGCDLCATFGYRGDMFYIGENTFTGEMARPTLCQRCFRRHAELFFERFTSITGRKLIMTETILQNRDFDTKLAEEYITLVKPLMLPQSYSTTGSYIKGWYFNLLERLVYYSKNPESAELLVKAKFLSNQ